MIFEYKYKGFSKVANSGQQTRMAFAPDASRHPIWFHGVIDQRLPFREAISSLHAIVTSDLRYQPRDTTEYQNWLKSQEDIWLAEFMQKQAKDKAELEALNNELNGIRGNEQKLLQPFYKAQRKYFNYLYRANRDWWFVLDPVITVHPDEISFECFSLDESSYGRLSCSHNVFHSLGDFSCGTTNIDYSAALYQEFQKIRNYKDTELTIDPEGFSVETEGNDSYREVKIDLPDSWVRGFLQVSSAMTMNAVEFSLHPMDLHNLLFHLKRRKEKTGPRSLRFILKPGQPLTVRIDPWNIQVQCLRSIYTGHQEQEIRIWGRRRLMTLERLIPVSKAIHVRLLGHGMPSFWTADMGDMQFTLGLSGWTANDWANNSNFDLLAPRSDVAAQTVLQVSQALRKKWLATTDELAKETAIAKEQVLAALAITTQEGKSIYDPIKNVWRNRELSQDPLPLSNLRFSNKREQKASQLVNKGAVLLEKTIQQNTRILNGRITQNGKQLSSTATIDQDERIIQAECSCNFHQQNKLMKGLCEHILALRVADSRQN